jgi:hypothetical protein
MSWLSDRLDEALAQINPFDKGRSAVTVRRDRPKPAPAQTVSRPAPVVNNLATRGASRVFDQLNPFDNNRTWQQRIPTQNKNLVQQAGQLGGQVARGVGQGTARTLNTVAAQIPQIDATARMYLAQATNNPTAYKNANYYAQAATDNFNRNKGGLINAGTLYSPEDVRTGSLATGLKRTVGGIAEAGLEVSSAGVGGFAGKQLFQQGLRQGARSQLPTIAKNAVLNTAQGATTAFNQDAGARDIARSALLSGAIGTAADVGLGAAGAGVVKYAPPVARQVVRGAQNFDETLSTPRNMPRLDVGDRAALEAFIDLQRGVLETSPKERSLILRDAMSAAQRHGIQLYDGDNMPADNVEQFFNNRRSVRQGGYVRNPLAQEPEAPQPGRTAPPLPPTTRLVTTAPDLPPKPIAQLETIGGGLVEPPEAPVTSSEVPTSRKTTRYASRTVPESEFVSDELGQEVRRNAPLYNVETERQRYTSSLSRLKQEGDDTFTQNITERLNAPMGKISSQDVADTQTIAAILDTKGDTASLQKAAELYDKLSEHLTAAGQTVQAAAILARRTPEGLRYHAQRTLKQNNVTLTPELQQNLTKLIAEVKRAPSGTPEGDLARHRVNQFVNDQIPSSAFDKGINVWRAGLLTAPTTTGGNLLGNTGESLVRKGFVNPVATGADALMSLFTGKRTQTLAPTGSATKGAIEGASKLPNYMKTGFDERNALTKYDTKELTYKNKAVGAYVNGVYRLMSVADQPYWYAARKEALGSIAKAEAINNNIPFGQRKQWVNKFMKDPPTEALERATAEAMYATFQNKTALGSMASGLKRGAGKARPIADFFIPFTQVPASIATRIVERTPVGTATEVVRQFINVKKGGAFDQRALSQAIGNGSFGPAVFAAGYSLANSGMLTFGYPEDPKERELWEAEGKQPYSVRVGDRWYSLNYLQPFGTLLAMGGQAKDAVSKGANMGEVISQGIATAGQSVSNQSFLKGIGGVLEVVDDPQRFAETWVGNTTSSLVPNFVRSAARAADPVQREAKGVVEGVKGAIPGLRQTLPEKRDTLGNPLPAKDNFFNQFMNPLRPSIARDNKNPVISEARRLYEQDNGVLPSLVNRTSLGEGTELDKNQIRDLQGRVSKRVGSAWGELIKTQEYKTLSDEDKAKALKNLSSDISAVEKREYAAEHSLGQYSPGFTGKERKLTSNQKRIAKGTIKLTSYARSSDDTDSSEYYDAPDAEYKVALERYEQDKSEGKITKVKNIERSRELQKLKVGSKFDKNVRDLYGMNKSQIYQFITTDAEGKKFADSLAAYDKALYDAGLNNSLKFKNGFAPAARGGGGGKKKSKFDYKLYGMADPLSTERSLRKLVEEAVLKA